MKKWDELRSMLTKDTKAGGELLNRLAMNEQWQQFRDLAPQVATGAAILANMDRLELERETRKADA
jgi:hypothetical protein